MAVYYKKHCKEIEDVYEISIRTHLLLHNHPEADLKFYGNIPKKKFDKIRSNGNGQVKKELKNFIMPEDPIDYTPRNNSYILVEFSEKQKDLEKLLLNIGFTKTEFKNEHEGKIIPFSAKNHPSYKHL